MPRSPAARGSSAAPARAHRVRHSTRHRAKRALAGDSLRALCLDLNERGVPTVTGTPWKSQTLKRILTSARISGQREHQGEIVAKAEWQPIITPAETQRLRAKLNDP